MTHIVTSLCVRDRGCIDVCPVECMLPGQPLNEWPWIYIDPDTCIDCGACVPECPYAAIFPEDEVPAATQPKAASILAMSDSPATLKVPTIMVVRSSWIQQGSWQLAR